MKLRRRGTRHDRILQKRTTTWKERSSGNTLFSVKWFQATGKKEEGEGEGCHGKVPLLVGHLFAPGLSLSYWAWQRGLTVASGLLVALLLALIQAYWVNSIHENLLWFSQLTVSPPCTYFFKTKAKVQLTFFIRKFCLALSILVSPLSMYGCTRKDLGGQCKCYQILQAHSCKKPSIYSN